MLYVFSIIILIILIIRTNLVMPLLLSLTIKDESNDTLFIVSYCLYDY